MLKKLGVWGIIVSIVLIGCGMTFTFAPQTSEGEMKRWAIVGGTGTLLFIVSFLLFVAGRLRDKS